MGMRSAAGQYLKLNNYMKQRERGGSNSKHRGVRDFYESIRQIQRQLGFVKSISRQMNEWKIGFFSVRQQPNCICYRVFV